jgi:ABC-type dipeptide/oligopeptide/nickel transport system permease component
VPRNVSRFEWLSYLALAAGLLSIVFNPQRAAMIMRHGFGAGIISAAFGVGLAIVPIVLIARRRQNWMRWLVGCLFVVGLPSFVAGIVQIYKISPMAAALETLSAVLAGAALWFVFTGDAGEWFGKQKSPSNRNL